MPSQVITTTENNFTKGLLTEFTGLNFPENAATAADNCEFTLLGDVTRRLGINYETNAAFPGVTIANFGISTYKWNNAGGDGLSQIVVRQVGGLLFFFNSTSATNASPLSTQELLSTVNIETFLGNSLTYDPTLECQYSDGNGYLFVYHPNCDPFYCTYTNGVVTGTFINVQIRDFNGIPESIGVTVRPGDPLTAEHNYNLANQGWTQGGAWTATSVSAVSGNPAVSPGIFTVAAGLPISNGDTVQIYCTDPSAPVVSNYTPGAVALTGTVSSYSGTTLKISMTGGFGGTFTTFSFVSWTLVQSNQGHINAWRAAIGNWPSNADVWWYFKDNTNVFNPTVTIGNITLSSNNAPQGHYLLSAFDQNRVLASSITGLTVIRSPTRPRTGAWFQGRVWYTGVDAQVSATGDAPFYTWTESIYFSQVVETPADFGNCYQLNDPTSENLFDLLPTDGGVIQIQGSGSIFKLFPIQNGMLVFAANGVWFITGSQGIGFSANDYTITKISSVRSISPYSFVNVNGLPYFWNQEGIYAVEPQQSGGLAVNPLTVGTILSFYNEIPHDSVKYARGDYDPINYVIQWLYRSTQEDSTDRYVYDRILNFNTYNKAFFPYTVDTASGNSLNGIIYVASPGGVDAPDPAFKYVASNGVNMSFADEHDTNYLDWVGVNYISTFTTGFKLHGQGQKRFQIPYIYTFHRNDEATSIYLQGIWDYAISGNSGRWSSRQQINNWNPNFGMIVRRSRIRGQGLVLQLKFTSVDGQPFDIMGWSTFETMNTGV